MSALPPTTVLTSCDNQQRITISIIIIAIIIITIIIITIVIIITIIIIVVIIAMIIIIIIAITWSSATADFHIRKITLQ